MSLDESNKPDFIQVLQSASELEDLLAVGEIIVTDMRRDAQKPENHRLAYTRAYWFHARITKIVASLGKGAPVDLKRISDLYIREVGEGYI